MEKSNQQSVLNLLDNTKTQWYHVKAVVIAGMGFFTDAYDLFCISLITKLLGRIYYHVDGSPKPGTLPPSVAGAVSGVALVGTLFGQLFFGWLGDRLGRKKVYGFTLLLMVACSVASGLSFGSSPAAVMTTLCFFRFWLGFGIGGDYPLSATIMAEYANKKTRGAFVAAVFAMQGFGILAGGVVAMIVSAVFKVLYHAPSYAMDPLGSVPPQADYVWRIILMVGAVPAALTFYYRMRMPETPRYTALVAKNSEKACQDMSKVLNIEAVEAMKKASNRKTEAAATTPSASSPGSSSAATASTFWAPRPPAKTMSALDELFNISKSQFLIALCGTVPGYWFTVALIDTLGRFAIQLLGFLFMTVFMFALAIPYHHWQESNKVGFLVMYGLTFFFANFGPNSTTFVVPAEIFPARLRSTCHGISAASGKVGAIVGAFGFLYASQSEDKSKTDAGYPPGIGMRTALMVLGGVNVLGLACTFFGPRGERQVPRGNVC
ncbi:phosphate transporter 1;7 [Actinidia rufa]|uniref:Phosphate transporter 17 n=1 Tax=Actinidia rufa TaxID=165716 RepID=A0A7J0EI69_9ERIC|nr:phosphate transporter 1;7 [Actinidia rufa]